MDFRLLGYAFQKCSWQSAADHLRLNPVHCVHIGLPVLDCLLVGPIKTSFSNQGWPSIYEGIQRRQIQTGFTIQRALASVQQWPSKKLHFRFYEQLEHSTTFPFKEMREVATKQSISLAHSIIEALQLVKLRSF